MADESRYGAHEGAGAGSPQDTGEFLSAWANNTSELRSVSDDEGATATSARFVRSSVPRRTVEPVDRLAEDEAEAAIEYVHDSDFHTTTFRPISGLEYRRQQQELGKFREGRRYGQYLEIPKGRRTIFAHEERGRRIKSVLALLFVVGLLAGVAFLIWELLGRLF